MGGCVEEVVRRIWMSNLSNRSAATLDFSHITGEKSIAFISPELRTFSVILRHNSPMPDIKSITESPALRSICCTHFLRQRTQNPKEDTMFARP